MPAEGPGAAPGAVVRGPAGEADVVAEAAAAAARRPPRSLARERID